MQDQNDSTQPDTEETTEEMVVLETTTQEGDVEVTETLKADMKLTPDEAESTVDTLLHLEQMIIGYLSDITRLREKMKSQKEMFKQSFEQDKDYSEVNEEQKAIKRKHNEVKQKIAKQDGVTAVKMTIEEIQTELKDAQQSLSDYLHRYVGLTQATSFTGPGGEVLTIVRSAKLVKKKD